MLNLLMLELWRMYMFISEERLCKAYRTMVDAYGFFDRYEGTESVPVRMYYLMDWYQEYFKDIPKEERREIEDVMKAAFRRFTPEDWDYAIHKASGVYSKMNWNRRKQKYLNQLRQNQMLEEVLHIVEKSVL